MQEISFCVKSPVCVLSSGSFDHSVSILVLTVGWYGDCAFLVNIRDSVLWCARFPNTVTRNAQSPSANRTYQASGQFPFDRIQHCNIAINCSTLRLCHIVLPCYVLVLRCSELHCICCRILALWLQSLRLTVIVNFLCGSDNPVENHKKISCPGHRARSLKPVGFILVCISLQLIQSVHFFDFQSVHFCETIECSVFRCASCTFSYLFLLDEAYRF